MWRFSAGLVMALCWMGVASAADQPVVAPPEAWVVPAEIPAPSAAYESSVTQTLLDDLQDRFTPEADEFYTETAIRIQAPQGLASAGTVALAWKPDTDTLIVHKLHIIRDGKVIDALASGNGFIVLRRENNLERAMLDGTLTAAIEPEGLEVGDIVDLAYTLKRHDPVLAGHSQLITGNLLGVHAGRLRLRLLWPEAKPIHWRETDGLAPPRLTPTGDGTELLIDMADTQELKGPKAAPPRFWNIGSVEASEFATWSDVSALMAPLYAAAAQLAPDSPIRAEAAKIAAASTDPKARAAAALHLVQDKIRYVFLGMSDGGYTPVAADKTWARRFGDCKGKTVLLLALLRELGIEAAPALVSTQWGDGLDARLPTVQLFDHVIIRAAIDGRTYWLDGTRLGDRSLDEIEIPPFKWALPVQAEGAALQRLAVPPLEHPLIETSIRIDASAGLDRQAAAQVTRTLRGDAALQLKQQLANLSTIDADQVVRSIWNKQYDWIEVKQVGARWDESLGEESLSLDGTANLKWFAEGPAGRRKLRVDPATLGWRPDYERDPGPHRDAPYAVPYPQYLALEETIQLPDGGRGFELSGPDIDQTIAGMEFHRHSEVAGGVFRTATSIRGIAPEFPASEAPQAAARLREMRDIAVAVVAPAASPAIPGAPAAAPSEPVTADDFRRRAQMNAMNGDLDAAVADLDRAAALDPGAAKTWLALAQIHGLRGEIDRSLADLDKARAIEPDGAEVAEGYCRAYTAKGANQQAVETCGRAIAANANGVAAYENRGRAYIGLHEFDLARADFSQVRAVAPNRVDSYALLAELDVLEKKPDAALAEADALIARAPQDPAGLLLRANVLRGLGRGAEALGDYDAAIALKPSAKAYIGRALVRGDGESAARLADIDLALQLEPKSVEALRIRAMLLARSGDLDGALKAIDRAVDLHPGNLQTLRERAEIYADRHQYDLAITDLGQVIDRQPGDFGALNERCWFKAISGQPPETALPDCEAALKLDPTYGPALDSRGLVHLRLGRFDESIADYDAALERMPQSPASLFGRGIAELRKGATDAGAADLAAARAGDAKIEAEFSGYGVSP